MARPILSLHVLVAVLLLSAGCSDVVNRVGTSMGVLDRNPGLPRPVARTPEPPPPVVEPQPAPIPPPQLEARVTGPEAERLLAGDPIAMRFLILHRLAGAGLIPPSDADGRIAANRGALLPLTVDQPPAAGLDRPVPPLDGVLARVAGLGSSQGKGSADTRAAERDFLVDSILPAQPAARQPLTPPDIAAARRALARLERLADTGLISDDERGREARATDALIESGRLPEVLQPPPPPPPPPKKVVKKPPHRGWKPEILPNPPGVEAPKLEAEAKGPAGVHLLSMASAGNGDMAWTALKKQFPDLAQLTYKVAKADLGELGVTYRLIAGPLEPQAAERLCGALRGQGQACMPTPFPQ